MFPPCVPTIGPLPVLAKDNGIEIRTGTAFLTDIGAELFSIAGSVPNEDYRALVVETLRGFGWTVDDNVQSSQTS